jgi:hypothetical protein
MRLKYRSILLKPGHDAVAGTNSSNDSRSLSFKTQRNMLVEKALLNYIRV